MGAKREEVIDQSKRWCADEENNGSCIIPEHRFTLNRLTTCCCRFGRKFTFIYMRGPIVATAGRRVIEENDWDLLSVGEVRCARKWKPKGQLDIFGFLMDVVLATRSAVVGERGIMTIISWAQMQSGAFEDHCQWKSTKEHLFACKLHQAIPI